MGGISRAIAKKILSQRELERADAQQAAYDSGRAPEGFIAGFFAARRANRYANEYWQGNQVINDASTPLGHMGLDLGHPPGCDCRWCSP
jgi:phosphopantetheinyl transferase (holo-ACP synthase)